MFEKGEIILAKFPFSSLESSKRKPCLVLSHGDTSGDLIIAFITSSNIPSYFKFSINLSPKEKNFINTGLKIESYIRIDKIATIHESLISGSIGKVSHLVQTEVDSKIKLLFGL
jgi:mRNA interferase MazF